jgi:hypothetical protein
MGVSYGKTKEEEYQKYSKLEPNVKYPVFILLDPDIIMTKCNIGMDHDCWQLLDALSEDDFKKACMGIVINSEEINILPNAYNDYGQESLQRILDNTGISEAIIKKNINRQIDNNTVARWLRSKMLEWHKQFGFSVPIYNKKHEIIWPVVDSGKKADNIQTNTKAYLLEKRNNYLNLIQQKTKFLGHYDEMTQTGFLEEIIELYENRLKEE